AALGSGLDGLRQALAERLGGSRVRGELRLPASAGRLHARLRALGVLSAERFEEDGWHLDVDAPRGLLEPLLGDGGGESAPLRALLAAAE
ncbi:MAG: GTPase HflX, partial [Xanthomonadaceae bacterium]|nr:GTPase HflX [Xanthomonadaceae bacterium]